MHQSHSLRVPLELVNLAFVIRINLGCDRYSVTPCHPAAVTEIHELLVPEIASQSAIRMCTQSVRSMIVRILSETHVLHTPCIICRARKYSLTLLERYSITSILGQRLYSFQLPLQPTPFQLEGRVLRVKRKRVSIPPHLTNLSFILSIHSPR
jgi:hypothetical protein